MIELIKKTMDVITSFAQKILNHFENKRKWKLKIYFLNQLVCTKRIDNFKEVADVFKRVYVCKIHKKHIFKTLNTQVILIPNKALFQDDNKKELHINCIVYEGVDLNEL